VDIRTGHRAALACKARAGLHLVPGLQPAVSRSAEHI
jgi:hypothetical protein